MSTPTQFPILGHEAKHPRACDFPNASIPWAMIASHEKQALHNHNQTLTHLASRGGLDYSEAIAVLEDRPWERMDPMQALVKLADMVKQWKAGTTKQQPIRELLREIVDYMDAWKEATGIDPDAANLDEVFDTDFQRNHRKKLDELGEYLWPNQDGMPNIHRSPLVAVKGREELLRAEIAKLTRKVFMPGTWHCDVCGFELNQRVLNPNTGAVGVPLMTEVPTCPNKDGSVMRQVTWEECAGENEKAAHRFLDERDEARQRYDATRLLGTSDFYDLATAAVAARPELLDKLVNEFIEAEKKRQQADIERERCSMPPGPPEVA